MSRGLKNNNPGNIRQSAVKYRGEVPSTDPAFKQFAAVAWGYRAVFMLLYTYQVRHGLHTIREMIVRYAPPNENRTDIYVDFVSRCAGVEADGKLDTLSRTQMIPVVSAISRMENGTEAVAADVEAGWTLFREG